MKRRLANVLVTGGYGFIGSNFIRTLFNDKDFEGRVINVDKLTYAGNVNNLSDVEHLAGGRYIFKKVDICDHKNISKVFNDYNIDTVVHFAAESHVDNSIKGPKPFIETNIVGTFTLLNAAKESWNNKSDKLFHHVSTDEVFGSLGEEGLFSEETPYDPHSPYSASKASSDHIVRSYYHTYGLPVTISNCSNNYGPYQFPEKLIPLMINNMLHKKELPVYGDGKNIRDWIHVDDHNSAVLEIIKKGAIGDTYTIGGETEITNIDLLRKMMDIVTLEMGISKTDLESLITYVEDRPGHDRRYAIDCSKIKNELGWKQSIAFDEGILDTIRWYISNWDWVVNITSGAYIKNNNLKQ